MEVMNTWLSPRPGTRLHVYSPADAATERRLVETRRDHRGPPKLAGATRKAS